MDRKIKLVLAYDGTEFHGWQAQPGQRTVQEELRARLARVWSHPVALVGASRTDAGVHACGQVAHLEWDAPIPAKNLWRALGNLLPPDVAVVHAREVPLEFHASRDALSKLYRYVLHNALDPPTEGWATRYAWHVWHALDLARMRVAAARLVGQHDFAGLANQGSPRESTVRTIHRIAVERRCRQVVIEVEGDGFLYNQVRILVGTLVEIGRGHWPPQRADEILATRDRRLAGPTAPAHGLTLRWVRYGPRRSSHDGA